MRGISLDEEEKRLICRMFEPENLVSHSGIDRVAKKIYRNKTYSCSFYNVKAVLLHLKEAGTPVIVKRLFKKGEKPGLGLICRFSGGRMVTGNSEKLDL